MEETSRPFLFLDVESSLMILLNGDVRDFLEKREFVYLATAAKDGHPYVAPKFLIHLDEDHIYLADFVLGRTIQNLKARAHASISVINMDNLIGYQINGTAKVFEEGAEYQKVLPLIEKRQMYFSVERIVEGVRAGKKHAHFEMGFPSKLAVIKFTVKEIINIAPDGRVDRFGGN